MFRKGRYDLYEILLLVDVSYTVKNIILMNISVFTDFTGKTVILQMPYFFTV